MKKQLFFQGITDFIFLEEKPEPADIIFVPGGNYPEAAIHAASMYREGWAPLVLPSGKYSILTGHFVSPDGSAYASEWEYLSRILIAEGVPEHAILREDQATFTWENAICSRKVLEKKEMVIRKAILSCQAFHARRCLMYYQEQFPDVEFLVCPVTTRNISKENWFLTEEGIDLVLGEMERCGGQFHEIMKNQVRGNGRKGKAEE